MLVEWLWEQMNELQGLALGHAGHWGRWCLPVWQYLTMEDLDISIGGTPWGVLKTQPRCWPAQAASENPDSRIHLWVHDGSVMISQWPKTTCFSLCNNCCLWQGEKFSLETSEPSCVWVLQTVSRFLSDVLVNGKIENTALSWSLLPWSFIQPPLIISVYWVPIMCNRIQ